MELINELDSILRGWFDISRKFRNLFDRGEKEIPLNIEVLIAQRALNAIRYQSFPAPDLVAIEDTAKKIIENQFASDHANFVGNLFELPRTRLNEIDLFVSSVLNNEFKNCEGSISRSQAQEKVEDFLVSCQAFSECISAIPASLREVI